MSSVIHPKPTLATFKLASTGTGVSPTIRPEGSEHLIAVDAAPAFGGRDTAPSPIAYVLGSLLSCSQVTAQLVAKDLGIELRGFAFNLSADLDTAVLVGGARDGNPNFESVKIEALVETDASEAQFAQLKRETERHCPIYQLFSRSGVDVSSSWRAVSV
jgi:uncharacterized OsmC-like protein